MKISFLKFKIFIKFATLIIFFGLLILVSGLSVYKDGEQNVLASAAVNFLPFPAARVNRRFVRLSAFYKNFNAVKNFYERTKGLDVSPVPENFDEKETKKLILSRLIENEIVKAELLKNKIKITKKDRDRKLQETIDLTGSSERMRREIEALYDLKLEDFERQIFLPSLAFEKLEEGYKRGFVAREGTSNFENWLDLKKSKAKVKIYLSDMKWNEKEGKVE